MPIDLVHKALEEQASLRGSKKYLTFDKDKYSYREINSKANKLANLLHKRGINKGDRVAVMLENSPEFFISLFGILKAGCVCIPINTFFIQAEVVYIINDSGAKLFVTSSAFKEVAEEITDKCPSLKTVMTYEDTKFQSENIVRLINKVTDKKPEVEIRPEDHAVFIYSSGTTGHPKGAMLTHFNLVSNAKGCLERFRVTVNDRFLLFLPSFHAYALMTCVILPTYAGSSIIILGSVADLKKKSFRNILLFQRPTFFLGVPQVYTALIRSKMPRWFVKFVYPVRLHVSGGAPLPEETLIRFREKFKRPIVEGYGLSEASPVVSCNTLERQKALSVGPALPGVEVKIVDENEVEQPVGTVGELIVKGPNVMTGYWNMPGLTDMTLRNGWLFTGDLAKLDEEGYIYIVDRKKDLIIVKGINVYPREIEELLHKHEAIEAAAVIGLPDKNSGEIPVAYIKPKPGLTISETDIKGYLRKSLAHFKIPKHIHLCEDMPMTATGKVLKRELKRRVLNI
ncbi:MAG: long-chain-fatty-acid--CoA ligase [Deferribacterales bacterium]